MQNSRTKDLVSTAVLRRLMFVCFALLPACDEAGKSSAALAGDGGLQMEPPCANQLKQMFATCPTSGTCTMSEDASGSVAHCYGDGSKDVMKLTGDGGHVSVFKPDGHLCYRVHAARRDGTYDVLSSQGLVIATVTSTSNGVISASCGGVTFNLNAYRPAASLNALDGCTRGACAWPQLDKL